MVGAGDPRQERFSLTDSPMPDATDATEMDFDSHDEALIDMSPKPDYVAASNAKVHPDEIEILGSVMPHAASPETGEYVDPTFHYVDDL